MNFTITNIDEETGNVSVVFDVDGKEQSIANLPVGDKQSLMDALTNYGIAYEVGLSQSTVTIDPELTKVMNKPQSVDVEAFQQAKTPIESMEEV